MDIFDLKEKNLNKEREERKKNESLANELETLSEDIRYGYMWGNVLLKVVINEDDDNNYNFLDNCSFKFVDGEYSLSYVEFRIRLKKGINYISLGYDEDYCSDMLESEDAPYDENIEDMINISLEEYVKTKRNMQEMNSKTLIIDVPLRTIIKYHENIFESCLGSQVNEMRCLIRQNINNFVNPNISSILKKYMEEINEESKKITREP